MSESLQPLPIFHTGYHLFENSGKKRQWVNEGTFCSPSQQNQIQLSFNLSY
jgi:hypothetical protein